MLGADLRGYDVPHQLVEQLYRDTGVRTNPLRGISFTANKFATETFMDEIARKRGLDPVEVPARAPEEHAARASRWSSGWRRWRSGAKRDGRGLGFAYLDYSGTQVAGIAEVSVDRGERPDQGA